MTLFRHVDSEITTDNVVSFWWTPPFTVQNLVLDLLVLNYFW